MKRVKNASYEMRKRKYGYVFIGPWLIGFILLFAASFIFTIIYSFNDVDIDVGRLVLNGVGFSNYKRMFLEDTTFLPFFLGSLKRLIQVPFIIMLSFFIAILLNQEFFGRTLARGIFFLPVIMMNGPVKWILDSDPFFQVVTGGDRAANLAEFTSAQEILAIMGLDNVMTTFIVNMTSQLFALIWMSGIQILIFISGLQSIPNTYYEVAKVEGATPWEEFWKITFPTVSPMLIVNVFYTMIDVLLGFSSPMLEKIKQTVYAIEYGYAAALAIVCFIVWALIILLVFKLMSRYVDYVVD